ncbi:MAG: excisionase family DNA-binding protein [Acidimicrobiales bacterium]|nr:excisionase family DNA-binding protein [Acidimicrobiales bacterium]
MSTATTKQVAAALGLSERTIRSDAADGRIPFTTTPGGHRRFDLAAVRSALRPEPERRPTTVPSLAALRRHRRQILRRASDHGARHVRVFGSIAAGNADADSDIDLLVTLDADRTYADVEDLEAELSDLLGHPVEIQTEGACHGRFADVLDHAVDL